MSHVRSARNAAALALASLLAACTSGQVGQFPVTSVNTALEGKLQFGVGWLTSYPYSPGNPEFSDAGYGLNLVETFRQANGRSAVLDDSVEVDVPPGLSADLLTTTPTFSGLALPTSISAFGAGLNSGSFLSTGTFTPLVGTGGPPAFAPPADSSSLTEQYSEGYYALFPVVPTDGGDAVGEPLSAALAIFPGQYTLNVTIPTGTTSNIRSASANLTGKPLPLYVPPSVTPDGKGGALVTITVPARVTETLVTIVAVACQAQAATGSSPSPVALENEAYTLVSHKAGPGIDRLTLPDFVTPIGGLGTYQSLCSAAQYAVPDGGFLAYAAGFDYPAFESVYPQNFSETPQIVGAAGQPDITISSPASFLTP